MIRRFAPWAGALVIVVAAFAAGSMLLGAARQSVSTRDSATQTHVHATAPTPTPEPIVAPAGASRVVVTTAVASKPELGYALDVKVTSPVGKPVNDAPIRFYDVVELFGQREELIGAATTDGQGVASITYLPATPGTHQIVARFAGQGALTPSLGIASLDASVAAPPYRVDQGGLAAFSRYVPYAAGVIVLAVWALIGFSLLGTARGIFAGRGKEMNRKGDTA